VVSLQLVDVAVVCWGVGTEWQKCVQFHGLIGPTGNSASVIHL